MSSNLPLRLFVIYYIILKNKNVIISNTIVFKRVCFVWLAVDILFNKDLMPLLKLE